MPPYRMPLDDTAAPAPSGERGLDPAMMFGLGLLVVASAVRVVAALIVHEQFGGEATLAFLVLLVTAGWAAGASFRALAGRIRRS